MNDNGCYNDNHSIIKPYSNKYTIKTAKTLFILYFVNFKIMGSTKKLIITAIKTGIIAVNVLMITWYKFKYFNVKNARHTKSNIPPK